MYKKALLALGLITWLAYGLIPIAQVQAQNTTCSDRPAGDSSNACANTRFVMTNGGGGGGGGGPCTLFTDVASGCVTASGGIANQFLRSDNTFAYTDAIPVGAVIPWSGATVPEKYLLALGQQISRTGYPDLFEVMTYSGVISCTSGSPTITVPTSIGTRAPIGTSIEAAACFAGGGAVVSKTDTTLTFNVNAGASTSTAARIFPWGNGDGSTTFNVPNLIGRSPIGRDNMSGSAASILTSTYYGSNPDALNALGGSQSTTLVTANLPAYTPSGSITGSLTVNDPGHTHPIGSFTTWLSPYGFPGVTSGGVAASLFVTTGTASSATTGITVTGSGMTLTGTAQGGSSTAFSTMHPSITMDYIVKVLPGGAGGGSGGGSGIEWATLGEMYQGTAIEKAVAPAIIWPPEVAVTYGTTVALDMSTFRDAVITLTGNITTMTLTNPTVGKSGSITFIQDGTGSRTTVFDSKFKFASGTAPTLTTTANAVDILSYQCRTSTFCFAAMMNDVR